MSHSAAASVPANSFRGWFARVWDDPDSRSTLVGLVGVLVIYLFLWLVGPRLVPVEAVATFAKRDSTERNFNIELAPDAAPQPVPPSKFVETNPDAPENVPDKTNNFSDRNQQVAQEKPTPDGKSDHPVTEGKKDFETTQIVSGQLAKPLEHMEAVPEDPTPPKETIAAKPRAEQNPLPGFEKKEGDDKEGIGTNNASVTANAQAVPDKVEGAKDASPDENAVATQPAIDPRHPRPRPIVAKTVQSRPAILAENNFGTTNIGAIAVDAKWSSYGQYLKQMIDIVQIQWERILAESKTYPPSGSTVTVKFILDSEGKIARIVNVDNHSTEQAARACVSGITDRAPYGVWPADMKAVLGEQQEMTFTFYYQ
ncbi:MAG TPA: hypothetical protein VHD62_07085 [Opitutaceae bacterium]|nr:hypothetical protein [Opitutaceae bacterium]